MKPVRLGLNIDHVATLRNARGGVHPNPFLAAVLAQDAGVDGITVHLREDRRHIRDDDVYQLKSKLDVPLNLEIAATDEMVSIACDLMPHAACIVPESRQELTTEGGLAVISQKNRLVDKIAKLKKLGIKVSLFMDPVKDELLAASQAGADCVELHTGQFCGVPAGPQRKREYARLAESAHYASACGLEVHAGHGLGFDTAGEICAITEITELNIGHFLIGEALFTGLADGIRKMRQVMDEGRGIT